MNKYMNEQINKWIWNKMNILIMQKYMIHMVNAIDQRIWEVIANEVELQMGLKIGRIWLGKKSEENHARPM